MRDESFSLVPDHSASRKKRGPLKDSELTPDKSELTTMGWDSVWGKAPFLGLANTGAFLECATYPLALGQLRVPGSVL